MDIYGGVLSMIEHYVFVYGTLRKGESNANFLNHAECVEECCTIVGQLYDTGYGYPALFKEKGALPVKGELYKVTSEQLKRLDRLEGYEAGALNNLYERVVEKIATPDGEKQGIVYMMMKKSKHYKRIEHNDWCKYHI
jgi:gamma-glutamylcyclotransferase (GGCT)/AIG2-like uncharacterized protein YtfP